VPPRVLTGIKPTGSPHVGNLYGAIYPALRLADQGLEAMYFIADYHALITIQDRAELVHLTREIAAAWLAMGLDPERVLFYRQSDIPEIFELAWALSCFTSKGWMNKAHAYKAAVAANQEAGDADVDAGINMGLYGYPILMAADILAFDIDLVPVGKDQVQHIEIARDIAQRFNHVYGAEVLRLPQAKLDDASAIVPGIDGRKMSKSYGNQIPLFAPAKQLEKLVKKIVTDSTPPEVPKDPDTSIIFHIYRTVAAPDETRAFADRLRAGIGWGEAKQALFARLEADLAPARARYDALMADPKRIDELLARGCGESARDGAPHPRSRPRRDRYRVNRRATARHRTLMVDYPSDITVGEARERYFAANGFSADTYTDSWVKFSIGPIPIRFPNTPSRKRAIPLHDIHHVATGYATTLRGEAEIGAWEIAGSCTNYWAAWVLNASAFSWGLALAPRRTYRAFVRGRHSRTLYRAGGWNDGLLAKTVGEIRTMLELDREPRATWHDRAAFAGWVALVVAPAAGAIALAIALLRW
jgi:tryptophanyl-tRNA synthetase